ncbi:MAG: low molecular weight phosphotyrosine protein phosphatase [Anaerolineales bacterium]|nr:low molecular weight phosphotyrosine protein phosphatase [Anaerolineales bacterium]
MSKPTRLLFVCLGNIIRSPLAARLFEHKVAQAGLADKYEIDSAGTGSWHAGEPPDERMVRTAARRGFHYTDRARQVKPADMDSFDLVVAMDLENKSNLEALAANPGQRAKIRLLREFDEEASGNLAVPDPWYGGPSGFDDAYDIIERSVEKLLADLESGALPVK